MLEEENVSMEFFQANILLDNSGKRLAATMDRFGFYLATNEGKKVDLLAWSVALGDGPTPAQEQRQQETEKPHACPATSQLLAVIDELIASNKTLSARLTIVEAALLKSTKPQETAEVEQDTSEQQPKAKRRKKPATNLSDTWYEWYTRIPRVWDSSDRQKKSESRHVTAFMKLFLDEGFTLDAKAEDYKDQVLDTGRRAEVAVLAFLKSRDIQAKGSGSVLRALRPLHKSGILDSRIARYKHLLAIGRIEDPAPVDTQDILAVIGHV
ncbi:serine/threonine-protein kinase drkC [Phytophthora nicotianae]|uniref:Serine/threonine-protein kinase drkC n=1 Tax=Phytophthora nicotianae TaxID=4792 RepID=A0A0W8CKA7_PHYNI|nr:serine/threonine-protein kinase drkC [Phytophthora nicotianae]